MSPGHIPETPAVSPAVATDVPTSGTVQSALLSSVGTGRIGAGLGDVGASREQRRRHRLWVLWLVLLVPAGYLWLRLLSGEPLDVTALSFPTMDPLLVVPILFFTVLIFVLLGTTVLAGRSPHVLYRPEQIAITFDDVIGIEPVKEDVLRSLNLFLAYKTFAAAMGGTPRRGLLFEGAPGTGKTYLAKAMAREAGVPFLFVSATSFQSMYYGATARKIRSYFKALRKAAQREGGAIGFIEEIDAIAMARGGLAATADTSVHGARTLVDRSMTSEGTGGVVNELLVQMQSFDEISGMAKLRAGIIDRLNLLLPAHRQLRRPVPPKTNVLLIAATNRADNLDPALLRPGRFDRRLTFEPPGKAGRRALLDYLLLRKSHTAELDTDLHRDQLAAVTQGYTPVMIEHLLDEALVNALRRGEDRMNRTDVDRARLVEEVGLGQPVAYTEHETRLIATHEAGHATVAYLLAPQRRLEILTIIKRRDALGLLAHGDTEDVFTRSRAELTALTRIAMGGLVAEELFFGDVSTGPAGDLVYATTVAAQMVGSAGMTDSLVSFAAVEQGGFGGTNLTGRVLADGQGRAAVEDLLLDARQTVRDLLGTHRHLVEALRDALLDRYELIGHEITDVLRAAEAAAAAVTLATTEPTGELIDLTDHGVGSRPRGAAGVQVST